MDMDGKFHIHGKPGARACLIQMWLLAHNFFSQLIADHQRVDRKSFSVARDAEHAWISLWLFCTVQALPRVRKKGIADGRKSVRPDAAAAQAPLSPSDLATTMEQQQAPATEDEQAAYVAAWRRDKTLQLAADISNVCT